MNELKLKRKYGDRADWTRVVKREFIQDFFDEDGFKGHVTMLKVIKITEPLHAQYGDKKVCIIDEGYTWLQHFPKGARHSVTTMFNVAGEIVQWYIDICYQNGIDNDRPWMDDLFLDIIILPAGEVFHKDADELELALSCGVIDDELYYIAVSEADAIKKQIEGNQLNLLHLTKVHKECLEQRLTSRRI
ncbi:DUF402 domain-containing protein [Mesobacillus selenatarsenatis]|uniref:DUF402 domain-containing protein n=1 Tax=Mesobacillus selenatarsenatis (strain DSM 18680 / JCM 14380 / FERM P-15431 / SF-1) TaxID=1321606 RepID=A0A0A8X4N0_MESS1|nr:DUF402 domain-containing protein [Mesobacillus selenatarsenatis]GAM14878.1 hypothetical protein SAMD00020551_3032 [Mesobacillus selenatarsenatis SF-1]